jgi:ribosome-associated protein
MLDVAPHIRIPREELDISFARSGGPGGQNVQKVSSKVLLRWKPEASTSLPTDVKSRLLAQQRHRLTNDGEILITSQRTRDQGRNLEDCLDKLRELIVRALRPPKARKATRPTRGSRERRLQAKRQRGQRKAGRKMAGWED